MQGHPHCDAMRAPLRVLVVGALTRTGQQVARSLAARRDDFTVTALCGREMGGSARSEVPPPLRSGEGQGLGGPALPPPAPPPPLGLWTLRPAPPGWPCSGPLGRRVSQRWWWRPRAAEGGVAESAWRRFGAPSRTHAACGPLGDSSLPGLAGRSSNRCAPAHGSSHHPAPGRRCKLPVPGPWSWLLITSPGCLISGNPAQPAP